MREFQAIILAGVGGNRMYPITNETLGKAMLPVCNIPMISYILHSFVRARIDETFIVTNAEIAKEISLFLNDIALPIKVEYEITSSDGDEGTADALRGLVDKIESNDVFVVSCDLLTTLPLHRLADLHRLNDAAVTCLFAEPPKLESDAPTDRRPKIEKSEDFIGMAADGKRVLLLKSQADCMDEEEVTVPLRLLRQHPTMTIHTNLIDTHCYILSKPTLALLKEKTNLNSLRRDFLPFLVKQSTRPPPEPAAALPTTPAARDGQLLRQFSALSVEEAAPVRKCCALILTAAEGVVCSRANSAAKYLEAHRIVPRFLKRLLARTEEEEETVTLVSTTAAVHPAASIGPDSMIGSESTIGEQTSLKRSAVGSHCVIGDRVKLVNSVVLDYATVAAGSTIQNSIVSRSAQVQTGVSLLHCQVAPSFTVPEKSTFKNETLAPTDDYL